MFLVELNVQALLEDVGKNSQKTEIEIQQIDNSLKNHIEFFLVITINFQ